MIGIGDLGLNLNSLNDSVASSVSNTLQDLYSYSNLNSASSLSWADDEVENSATMKVQHYLDNLEEYLVTGDPPRENCFIQSEAEQWMRLISQFNLHKVLKETRRLSDEDFHLINPRGNDLEVHGQSFSLVRAPASKSVVATTGYNLDQTPRVRTAYPSKKQILPIRIRSAYPLNSPTVSNNDGRTGVRSGYANTRYRSRSPFKNDADYMKIIEDASRLSIQKEISVRGDEILPLGNKSAAPLTKNYTQLKRIRLQPAYLPKFTESVHETTNLPPLVEAKSSLRSKVKTPKTTPVIPATNLKSANSNHLKHFNGESHYFPVGRKPTSATQYRNIPSLSKTGQFRQMYNIPSSQTTLRPGNHRNEVEMNIELVGTSLSLFEPIVRPVRPVITPKLRTHF